MTTLALHRDSLAAAPASADAMVLHVRVVAGSGGGPDKTIIRSAHHYSSVGLPMAAAYIRPQDDPGFSAIREQARVWDCDLHEIAESGAVDPRSVHALLRLCRKLNVSIWHGHDYKSNLLGLILNRFHPMALLTTVHGWTGETWRTRLYEKIDRWCLPRYDRVIAVSQTLYDQCLSAGVSEDRLHLVSNGIDTDDYRRKNDRQRSRAILGIRADRLVIGVVGRLSAEKGAERAVQTLAGLLNEYPTVELHLIGDGPERPALERLAADLGVADAVRFWGWQQQTHRHYEAMDLLFLPSRTEGLPNAVLEAMAMGVPVAASNVGGVEELLDHGRCGVVLNGDTDAWRRQIAPLLVSAARRDEFARRGRERVEHHYSFTRRMEQELAVYEQVLGRPLVPIAEPARRAA